MRNAAARAAACGLALLGTAGPGDAQMRADIAAARTLASESAAAYSAGDLERAHERLARALTLRPRHPVLLYASARIQARRGDADAAMRTLQAAAGLGLFTDPAADTAFAGLATLPDFIAVQQRLIANGTTKVVSDVAFTLDDPDFLPEGIAWDPVTRSFFIGSVHRRAIVRVDSTGAVSTFAAHSADLWGVFGMAVDPQRRALWVTTAAVPEVAGFTPRDSATTRVTRYDIATAQPTGSWAPPACACLFGDVTVDAVSGDVFMSDARGGSIFRIRAGRLEPLVHAGTLDSPQGMALLPDSILAIADYGSGIWRLDLRTLQLVPMDAPHDATPSASMDSAHTAPRSSPSRTIPSLTACSGSTSMTPHAASGTCTPSRCGTRATTRPRSAS